MKYIVNILPDAEKDLLKLKRSEPKVYKKAMELLDELYEHPALGTGKPEKLKWVYAGYYSRRITEKHRMIYKIAEEIVTVIVVEVGTHYKAK